MDKDLFASTEIVGAVLANRASSSEIADFAKDPKAALTAISNVDTDISISVVENSSDTIHLSLPYYSMVEELQAEMLKDSSVGDVAGGEILFVVGALIGGAIAGTAGCVVGGITGGVVAGTAIAAGAAVAVEKHGK